MPPVVSTGDEKLITASSCEIQAIFNPVAHFYKIFIELLKKTPFMQGIVSVLPYPSLVLKTVDDKP